MTDNVATYYNRGLAYYRKGAYDRAIADFVKAKEYDQTLKFQYPISYIASRIDAINDIDKVNAFRLSSELLNAIDAIQAKLVYKPQEAGTEVAHYTSLHAFKNMAQKGRFRLYNTAYMNDPEEGSVFYDMMKKYYGMAEMEYFFYGKNANHAHRSPAYIGSFTRIGKSEKDNLSLWRIYGKHAEQEATGSCFIFKRTCFAKNIRSNSEICNSRSPQMKIWR